MRITVVRMGEALGGVGLVGGSLFGRAAIVAGWPVKEYIDDGRRVVIKKMFSFAYSMGGLGLRQWRKGRL